MINKYLKYNKTIFNLLFYVDFKLYLGILRINLFEHIKMILLLFFDIEN